MRVAFAFSLITVGLAGGCGAARKSVAVSPDQFGVYRFSERLNPGYTFEGEFLVEGDTVTVDAAPGPCRYEPTRTSGMAIVYTCGTVTVSFDRADPIRKARYTATVRVSDSRTVCVSGRVVNGQQVCDRAVAQTSERDALKSGTLRAERVEPVIGTPIPRDTTRPPRNS